MKKYNTLLVIIAILSTNFIFAQFPQKQVNSAYNYEIGKLKSLNSTNNLSEKSFHSNDENITVDIKSIKEAKATYSIGLNDTLLVDNDMTINGDLFLKDNGVLIVDDGYISFIRGQIIHSEKYSGETKTIPVNISNYAKGLYFVKIAVDEKCIYTKKIVIQ